MSIHNVSHIMLTCLGLNFGLNFGQAHYMTGRSIGGLPYSDSVHSGEAVCGTSVRFAPFLVDKQKNPVCIYSDARGPCCGLLEDGFQKCFKASLKKEAPAAAILLF